MTAISLEPIMWMYNFATCPCIFNCKSSNFLLFSDCFQTEYQLCTVSYDNKLQWHPHNRISGQTCFQLLLRPWFNCFILNFILCSANWKGVQRLSEYRKKSSFWMVQNNQYCLFDQCLGASHSKPWLKSPFLYFSHIFGRFWCKN